MSGYLHFILGNIYYISVGDGFSLDVLYVSIFPSPPPKKKSFLAPTCSFTSLAYEDCHRDSYDDSWKLQFRPFNIGIPFPVSTKAFIGWIGEVSWKDIFSHLFMADLFCVYSS